MKVTTKIISFPAWLLATVLLLAVTFGAGAHAFLYYAVPRVGSTVTNSPSQIRICFTMPLKPHGSTIQVRNAKGKEVDKTDSHGDFKDPSLLFVSLPKLPNGTYTVIWHAHSTDNHWTEGHFKFTIK